MLGLCAMRPRMSHGILAFFLLFITVIGMAGNASAQTAVDWVVNVDDNVSGTIPAGGTIEYNVTISNNEVNDAGATTVDLTIPANAEITGVSGSIGPCTPATATGPATITCDVPALVANVGEATATVSVQTATAGNVSLEAEVPTAIPGYQDNQIANNAATASTTVTAGADLSLSMSGPPNAASGETITYTFTAENLGPNVLNNGTFEFPVPTGFQNITPPAGCSLSAGTYTCPIAGPVAVGASVGFDFTGQIVAAPGSTMTPLGSVSGADPADPVSGNNTTSMNTTVTPGSDLAIGKSRAPSGNLLVGDPVTFTLSPSYTGGEPNRVVVTDIIPPNYNNISVFAPGGWTCVVSGQTVTCERPGGYGTGVDVSLGDIVISADVASAGNPRNAASITADGPVDPSPGNNTDDDGGVVIEEPYIDLDANKSGPNPPLVVVGNTYNFPISATNVGNEGYYGTVRMTDDLPAGLDYIGANLNGWTCTPSASPGAPVSGPAQIVCEREYTAASPLAADASTPSVIIQTVATGTGSIPNSMTVSTVDPNLPDNNAPNDTATYTTTGSTGPNSADIALIKTRTEASLPVGEIQTFVLEITNAGDQTSEDIDVIDNLTGLMNDSVGPVGAGFIDAAISGGVATGVSCSTAPSGEASHRLTCNIDSLPVCIPGNNCPTITVRVRPGGNAGARTNTATAISNGTADNNLTNNEGSVGYTVESRADVSLTKVASPDPVAAGQNLTYVLTATNEDNGLSTANAVTVTDTLPHGVTFVSAAPSVGSCGTQPVAGSTTDAGNDQLVCSLGNIGNGVQNTITVVVRPNNAVRGQDITNTAVIATSTTDENSGNDNASVTTHVADPVFDLLVNKIDGVDPVAVGENTTYTITVTNSGPSVVENVVVTDTLPATMISYQSHSAPGASCATEPTPGQLGGTLSCSYASLAAGQSRSITVTMRGAAKGTPINNASVSSDQFAFDTNGPNNTDNELTTVRTRADVRIASKIPDVNPVNVRDDFNFVIRVENVADINNINAEADGVEVTDNLPANMELVGTPSAAVITGTATSTSCTGAAGSTSFTCDLGTLSQFVHIVRDALS